MMVSQINAYHAIIHAINAMEQSLLIVYGAINMMKQVIINIKIGPLLNVPLAHHQTNFMMLMQLLIPKMITIGMIFIVLIVILY